LPPIKCAGTTKVAKICCLSQLFKGSWSIMSDPNWFQKKWGFPNPTPGDVIYQKLEELEDRIKVLEEENVELTNELYRMENSLDARIDILADRCRINYDV
jgi:hypothetical protein